MSNPCPICGHQLERQEGTYTFTWPEGASQQESHFENAVWERCAYCGEDYLPDELVERIEQQRYVIDGLLTPAEIKAIRERLGLTPLALAQRLRVEEKTYSSWENGLWIQSRLMDDRIRNVEGYY